MRAAVDLVKGVDGRWRDIGDCQHHLFMGEVFRGSEALSDGALTEYQLRQWYRPNHRSDRRRFVKDIDKLGIAEDQGWIVIRVVSEHRPRAIVNRVYRALARRGWHPDRRQRAALSRFLELASISA